MSNGAKVLWIGSSGPSPAAPAWGAFEWHHEVSLDAAVAPLQNDCFDALLVRGDAALAQRLATWPALSQAVLDAAVVVAVPGPTRALADRLLPLGVQDLIDDATVADPAALGRRLYLAIQRKRLEREARKSHATDLATGLPNHGQLLEHMTHLLALREREPAPMALLALRIEGLSSAEARLGAESANVLRRKAAVRLRAALRASDVVASLGSDVFAVLLAWIDAPADGKRVATKLVQALQRPFNVTGHDVAVAVSAGLSLYPEHGKEADALLRRAVGQAAGAVAAGRAGMANIVERGPASAANDED